MVYEVVQVRTIVEGTWLMKFHGRLGLTVVLFNQTLKRVLATKENTNNFGLLLNR